MTRPACVLFDLDDTLAHYDHGTRVRVLAERVGVAPARIEAELFASGLEHETDLGVYDPSGQAAELARRLGVAVSLDDCIAARAAAMAPDADVIALAERLAPQATLAILSNNGALIRDHLAALCPPLAPLFGGRVFCSADFGIGKPDPAIYLRCAERLGLTPARILFVDDKAANADGARAVGMQAHHHGTSAGLRAALQAYGFADLSA
jgi:HAD superfamily hydrolase (TIGR01509 family)